MGVGFTVGDCEVDSKVCLSIGKDPLLMMHRAIFGLLYDYALYSPTDAEMGITEDMLGHQEADLSDDPLTTESEKPLCYDCPSTLWCGDCPDSDRCNEGIQCHDCDFEEGCLEPDEVKDEFPRDTMEVSFEVTDEPLSDMINDAASFAAMNTPVVYPSIAEYVNPAEDPQDEAYEGDDATYVQMDDLRDEAYAEDKAQQAAEFKALYTEEEKSNPHMLNGYPDREVIDHPSHYAEANIPSGIECWDWYELAMTAEEFIGHMKGNVLKYVFRAGRKSDGAQDLEKAGAYLKRWLSYLDGNRTVHMKGKKNDG
jgi:hypothetical protein